MKKCPYCSEKIQDTAIKCRFCGEWLKAKESIENNEIKDIKQHQSDTHLRICHRCNRKRRTQWCFFKQNVSYFLQREEKDYSGYVCFSCMSKVFGSFTMKTLFGTWWGIIGSLIGPAIIGGNVIEYFKNTFKFIADRLSNKYK